VEDNDNTETQEESVLNELKDIATISSLQEKHENKFTTIQYRLWGEMIDM